MANNDQIILDQTLEQQRTTRFPTMSKSDFFETFVAEQILKDFDLSDEEIESGLVGSGGDGGTDGIYIFANGELVLDDFDFEPLKKNVLIEVVIIQSKTSPSFGEDAMLKAVAFTKDLFDLGRSLDDFKSVYNAGIRSAVGNFRRLYTGIAGRFPRLHFRYCYASRGNSAEVHPNVKRKAEDLRRALSELFSFSTFKFDFLGAGNLLEMARREPLTTYEMAATDILNAKDGYIALVRIDAYYQFIRDETGQLQKTIFDANVRDYQGSNQVNEEIQNSLQNAGKEDFWWLNNGVTVVATHAVQTGKVLTIEDPQIVNGQQSSTEIFNYCKSNDASADERCVMVRVIVVKDAASRDRIIKATNTQTSIPPASLHATDKIHRDIEEYLEPFGIYYDRRKNSQKNRGRPSEKIIGISLLAQAIMAILLQRPDDARARPSSLLKKESDYKQLFSPEYPIEIYRFAATIIKQIQSRLRLRGDIDPKDRTNVQFYVATHVTARLIGKLSPAAKDLVVVDLDKLSGQLLDESIGDVLDLYQALGANDQVAKGPKLLEKLKGELESEFVKGQKTQG
jgi:hypothetical protein